MRLPGLLLTFSLLVCSAATAEAGQKLRIATEGAYPPFNYVDASGELGGFDVDIAKAICAEIGGDCSYVAVPWDRIIDGLEKNDYDLIVASMSFTPERAARISFSDSYYRSHSGFVGDPAKVPETTPEALAGRRIVVQGGTIQSEYVRKFYPRSEILEGKDVPEALAALAAGRADVTLIDAIQGLDWMQKPEGERFSYIGDPVTGDFLQSSSHIAARKGDSDLVGRVNAAIKHLRLNGTYDRINAAYFPFSIF
jgi:ABC-type amino acid transport substrate-binding protein